MILGVITMDSYTYAYITYRLVILKALQWIEQGDIKKAKGYLEEGLRQVEIAMKDDGADERVPDLSCFREWE